MNNKIVVALIVCSTVLFMVTVGSSLIVRKLLFYPTHDRNENGLVPWRKDALFLGFYRPVASPKNIWLLLHGNAGQASDRLYAIPSFSTEDSVFILEYPGYGDREGVPSRESFNQAAKEAYLFLRDSFPDIPVCVAGESIGSGPASSLAGLDRPPDKLVLIVPFEKLSLVARDHFPSILVSIVLKDDWDNIAALSKYKGPVEIFGAKDDVVIPIAHAWALAASIPSSKFMLISGGHNDWSQHDRVRIRNP
jgi:uncharacterized protein